MSHGQSSYDLQQQKYHLAYSPVVEYFRLSISTIVEISFGLQPWVMVGMAAVIYNSRNFIWLIAASLIALRKSYLQQQKFHLAYSPTTTQVFVYSSTIVEISFGLQPQSEGNWIFSPSTIVEISFGLQPPNKNQQQQIYLQQQKFHLAYSQWGVEFTHGYLQQQKFHLAYSPFMAMKAIELSTIVEISFGLQPVNLWPLSRENLQQQKFHLAYSLYVFAKI